MKRILMKMRVLMVAVVSAVLLFLITGILYAANGDLIVNGTINAGTGGIQFPDGTAVSSAAYVKISDTRSNGVNGQPLTNGVWNTRNLNTKDSDDAGIASLASNQITLPVGTYICRIYTSVSMIVSPSTNASGNFKSRLRNITDETTALAGMRMLMWTSFTTGLLLDDKFTVVVGKFSIPASKTFEVQTYAGLGLANSALLAGGFPGRTGENEVYLTAEFWKIK